MTNQVKRYRIWSDETLSSWGVEDTNYTTLVQLEEDLCTNLSSVVHTTDIYQLMQAIEVETGIKLNYKEEK